jgi:hypothetical protein
VNPKIFLILCAALQGCAATPVEVRGSHTPADAARLMPVKDGKAWVVRGGARTELPADAKIEGKDELRVTFPKGARGAMVRKLEDGDAIVEDDQGRIVAVRAKNGLEQRFEPGTAHVRDGSDEILVEQTNEVPLAPSDRIELLARYTPGDTVPGQGKVEERRKLSALVLGGIFLVMGYGPAVYVGATSPLKQDRLLVLPVLGPWIDILARPKCNSGNTPIDPCTGESLAKAAVITSGIVQAIGTVLFVVGLPAEAVVVKDEARGVSIEIGPMGAHGTF